MQQIPLLIPFWIEVNQVQLRIALRFQKNFTIIEGQCDYCIANSLAFGGYFGFGLKHIFVLNK